MEKPTFTPSILINTVINPEVDPNTGDFKRDADGKHLLDPDGRLRGAKDAVCHVNVIDGMLHFAGDSTHEFAGKIVPMEPF
jgi:hypothetical protein